MGSIVIVGGGFSGTMVATHLLRSGGRVRVILIERLGPFGGGIAYGTRCASHVLNVPAARMSAFEDDPDHFLRWLRARDAVATGGSFIQRPVYGQYVRHVLADAEASAAPGAELERIPGEAVGVRLIDGSGVQVRLAGGRAITADAGVLAIGNYPPPHPEAAGPGFCESPCYARDPWAHDALAADPDKPVLLIGTGLTMLDIALALRDQGHSGSIHAVSRRGLLPQPHRVSATAPRHHDRPETIDTWPRTAKGLLRAIRAEVARAAEHGVDWREVVTSIRADTPALWASLPESERSRFLVQLRPFWETHRHRAAPQTWTGVEALIRAGQLKVQAARIIGLEPAKDGIGVVLKPRGGADTTGLTVGRVINCTGPDTDLSRIREPLIASMRDEGLIRPDSLGLGLDTDATGSLIDQGGTTHQRLFLVGPLRKGRLWENTAVPELRVEARRLAEHLGAVWIRPQVQVRRGAASAAGGRSVRH